MVLEEVNWGIVGCGDVTEVKSVPPLYREGDIEEIVKEYDHEIYNRR